MPLDLNTIWFVVLGTLLAGYAVLDGFDLGVGAVHLFARTDEQRRIALNAIGPVWDGNEVWLVTGGGALFAAFPGAYASVFSGFYLVMILLLFALIFRAVAIEFRSKERFPLWRQSWDVAFCGASVLAAFLLGVALGNVIRGIPLDAAGDYHGSFVALLNPYALLTGATTVALFALHGTIYLLLKTDGEMFANVRRWLRPAMIAFLVCYGLLTMTTLIFVTPMTESFRSRPWLFVFPLVTMLAVANLPREIHRGRTGWAFASSCCVVFGLFSLVGLGMYPTLVRGIPEAHSLTIYNSASSARTLRIMLIIAGIGAPLVAAYTVSIYWIFRGRVKLDEMSY